MKFIIFNMFADHAENDFKSFVAALRGVPGAGASRARMMVEANGHQVYFKIGTPYETRNKGLSADISIPHYDVVTWGSKFWKSSANKEYPMERIMEMMRGANPEIADLVREYGPIVFVRDFETWHYVKAYGTCQYWDEGMELWTFNGKLYRLCLYSMPLEERKKVSEAYQTI